MSKQRFSKKRLAALVAIAAMALLPISNAQADSSRHGVVKLMVDNLHAHNHRYYDDDYAYSFSYSNHRPWYSHRYDRCDLRDRHRHRGWDEHRGHKRHKHNHKRHDRRDDHRHHRRHDH